ncbi:TPA: hypothetical protein ACGXQA_005898 [Bacillus mobilis]
MPSVDFKGFSQYDQRELFEVRLDNRIDAVTFMGNFNFNRGNCMMDVEAYVDRLDDCLVKVTFTSRMTKEQVETGIRNLLAIM